MKEKVVMAAIIAAILCCAAFAYWAGERYPEEYKDVYEQMRMERLITGNAWRRCRE